MNFIERVMRVMTHLNIGVALGLALWVLWSGWGLVTGRIVPAHTAAEVRAMMRHAPVAPPLPLELVPVGDPRVAPAPCHEASPRLLQAGQPRAGADS